MSAHVRTQEQPTKSPVHGRHKDKRGQRLPRGIFWYAAGVYGVRFVCGAGHDHKEPVGRLKEDAVRVHHQRRARVLEGTGWCPRAERQARRVQRQAEEARQRARMTFSDYGLGYLAWAEANKRSARQERSRFNSAIVPALGDRYLDEITTADVERFRDSLVGSRTGATANRYRDQLSAMFRRAVRLGLLSSNPVKGVPKFRESGQRLAYLTFDEEATVLEALVPRLRPAFIFSIHTGLRWSEQAAIRWRDVDVLTGTITVPLSKNGTTRRVPMNSTVRSTVMDLGASRQRPNDPGERLFHDSYRQTARLFGQAVKRAQALLQEAGKDASRLEGYTWHSNRHSFASRLAMAGVDLRTVQVLGGWKTLSMVTRYSHLSSGHLHAAVERLVAPAEPESSRKMDAGLTAAQPVGVS